MSSNSGATAQAGGGWGAKFLKFYRLYNEKRLAVIYLASYLQDSIPPLGFSFRLRVQNFLSGLGLCFCFLSKRERMERGRQACG